MCVFMYVCVHVCVYTIMYICMCVQLLGFHCAHLHALSRLQKARYIGEWTTPEVWLLYM